MRPRPLAWSLAALSLPQREAPPLGSSGDSSRCDPGGPSLGYFAETPRAATGVVDTYLDILSSGAHRAGLRW